MKNNITLIGMPGSGKSTVGVVLAKRLGRRFVDSDLVIQERHGKLLHELITEHGVEGGQTLRDLYEERTPLYEKYADLIIDCSRKMLRDVVAEIAERYKKQP